MVSAHQRRLASRLSILPALAVLALLWSARPGDDRGPLPGVGGPWASGESSRPPLRQGTSWLAPRETGDLLWLAAPPPPSGKPILDRAGWTRRSPPAEGGQGSAGSSAVRNALGGAGLDAREFEALDPRHQDMVMRLVGGENDDALSPAEGPVLQPEVCFSPGTRPEVVRTFAAARRSAEARRLGGKVTAAATQLGSRWTQTATISSGFSQGDPTTLTWSLVPDGTNIPGSGAGEPTSPSDFRAWLDARYGSASAWLPLLTGVFQRWSEVTGVTYIYEPDDDGAAFPSSPGVLGVRGDIRLAGHFIDGGFDVLAYNYFPQQGDMVIDTADSYFADTSNNSQKLRTVVAHENGHGLALRHVCPINSTKLMEPFISSTVATPRLDDIYSVQRLYGDRFEPNNTRMAPHDLGALPMGVTTMVDVSVDDNSDVDFVRFVAPADGVALSATLRPVGVSYLEAAQDSDGSCPSGTTFNALNRHNLNLELRASDGTTVLIAANSQPTGQAETISDFELPDGAGPYFFRINAATTTNSVQLYELELELELVAPAPRQLAIGDVTVNEGGGSATLTVSVAPPAAGAISVPWQSSGTTASPGADFASGEGTAVISPGASSTTIPIPIVNDALDENNEAFSVQLSAPPNATLADGAAVVTILDDDPLPVLSVAPAGTDESAGLPVSFTATLSTPSGRSVRVNWATADSSSTPAPAQSGADYVAASGTLTLASGQTSGTIGPISVINDGVGEPDETFDLNLAGPFNVVLGTSSVAGTIDDDDAPLDLARSGWFAPPDSGGRPVIAWTGVIGRHYRVETSVDLITWAPLPGPSTFTATQAALSFTDTSTGDDTRRYYRVLDVAP